MKDVRWLIKICQPPALNVIPSARLSYAYNL